jgi:hypothetical protein
MVGYMIVFHILTRGRLVFIFQLEKDVAKIMKGH